MSEFVPKKEHLREVLLHYFLLKKSAAESYRILQGVYGEHCLSQNTCERWFNRFKVGDFDVSDKERPGQPKKFQDSELEELLDEDPCQTQKQLAERLQVTQAAISKRLNMMGKILKAGKWVPHNLNERQMENRKVTSLSLLSRYEKKSFLHRIVTGDEKWIYFENPKRKKSYVNPGQPAQSIPRPNRYGKKTMLCIWWDQKGILYHELLKPGETVNGERYKQQLINLNQSLIDKRPEWAKRHDKVILLHDNAPSHTTKLVKDTTKKLGWEVLAHPPYSPDLAPSDYHLFSSMAHALAEQHFKSYEDVEKWLSEWFAAKEEKFFWKGIHNLPLRWEKCINSNGNYFE